MIDLLCGKVSFMSWSSFYFSSCSSFSPPRIFVSTLLVVFSISFQDGFFFLLVKLKKTTFYNSYLIAVDYASVWFLALPSGLFGLFQLYTQHGPHSTEIPQYGCSLMSDLLKKTYHH